MKTRIAVIALLFIFFILTLSTALRTSATCDEIAHHIPVGYILLSKWDFKMDTSQPPVPRYIVALPLKLFMKINIPDDKKEWRKEDRSVFGRDFFYKYNNDPKKMVLLSRIPVMIMGILCGLLLFKWTTLLYGENAGLLSLFLYCFSPNILAHASLATTDMIATFFIFLSVYAFWVFLRNASFKNIFFAGLGLGLAQLSKYSAILLYPIFILILIFELPVTDRSKISKLFVNFGIIIFISLVVIWSGYGFDFQPVLKDAMRVGEKIDIANKFITAPQFKNILLNVPIPLGTHFLGILGVLKHSHEGHANFFLGEWSSHGNPLYFLTAFVIKNPIPMLIFFIIGIFTIFKNRINTGERVILITIILFFAISSFSNLQIGLRHILPLFPLCFIVSGRSIELLSKNRLLSMIKWFLILWIAVSSVIAWPNYFGYFNELIGGCKNGYKILRDSNLDWGQDLPAVSDYMAKHKIDEVVLEYFGESNPAIYGVKYRKFKDDELLSPGANVYAISAQYLEHAKWTKGRKPDAIAGSSIFIYDLRKKDLR